MFFWPASKMARHFVGERGVAGFRRHLLRRRAGRRGRGRSATPPARTNPCRACCAGCSRSGRRRSRPWRSATRRLVRICGQLRFRNSLSADIWCSRRARRMVPAWASMAGILLNSPRKWIAPSGCKREAEIHLLARHAFQVGEQARDGMRVLPDMAAGAFAAADAFPAVKAAVAEPIAGGRGEDGRVEERAIQEPPRQRADRTRCRARGGSRRSAARSSGAHSAPPPARSRTASHNGGRAAAGSSSGSAGATTTRTPPWRSRPA